MFDMFRGMGQLASMMKDLPRMKEKMEQMQGRLAQTVVEGDAGAGMVKVRANCRMEILGITLADEALKGNDREMLEDLIKAAVNQALTRAKQTTAEETAKMMGLPPGMNLPGVL
jgi:DNA-binding YbaB/EbfC family protein